MIKEITFLNSRVINKVVFPALERHGVHIYHSDNPSKIYTHHVACWGWKRGRRLRERGHDVLVFERGYLGDRFNYTSVGWNGLNGNAQFMTPPEDKMTYDRFKNNFRLKPWRDDGDTIIIMGQVRGDASLKGEDMTIHYNRWARHLQNIYPNKRILFRPHPKGGERKNFKPSIPLCREKTLEASLANAYLTVCYNSNSAVDSLVNGVPAVVMDKGSMAWPVAGHQLDERLKPDLTEWLTKLSYCQWSIAELGQGDWWLYNQHYK